MPRLTICWSTNFFLLTDSVPLFFNHIAEAGLGAPQMVVMSDTEDPFVPLPDDLLVNLRESRAVFENLLDAIPATFAANSQACAAILTRRLTTCSKL